MQPTLFKTQVSCLRRKFFPAVLCYTNIGLLCEGDGAMQIAIVDDRADDRAELSESCRPGQFSTCLYGHLYGEHGWNGDAKFKKAIESFQFDCFSVSDAD